MKRVELPYSEEEKIELQYKVERGELDGKVAFKKRVVLRDDMQANLERYRKLIRKIPSLPGNLVIGTSIAGEWKVLCVFRSNYDLSEEFRTSQKEVDGVPMDRFNWLKKLIVEDGLTSICFRIGRED